MCKGGVSKPIDPNTTHEMAWGLLGVVMAASILSFGCLWIPSFSGSDQWYALAYQPPYYLSFIVLGPCIVCLILFLDLFIRLLLGHRCDITGDYLHRNLDGEAQLPCATRCWYPFFHGLLIILTITSLVAVVIFFYTLAYVIESGTTGLNVAFQAGFAVLILAHIMLLSGLVHLFHMFNSEHNLNYIPGGDGTYKNHRICGLLFATLLHAAFIACVCVLVFARGCNSMDASSISFSQKGFTANLYAKVPNARSLTLTSSGQVIVGTSKNEIYIVSATPGASGIYPSQLLFEGFDFEANGVAYDTTSNTLFVATRTMIYSFPDSVIQQVVAGTLAPSDAITQGTVIVSGLPNDDTHPLRYLRIGPDRMLYFSIGAPCNLCVKQKTIYSSIQRVNMDGSGLGIYAAGVRFSMGFSWNPTSGAMWFTENGRDWLSNYRPPDELNTVPTLGLNFGFPYCYGKNVPDGDINANKTCTGYIPSTLNIPAQSGAAGMLFYTGTMFPTEFLNQMFIAEYGSWNRHPPAGFRVVVSNGTTYETFASGFLGTDMASQQAPCGRPVDLAERSDGSLLLSDELSGQIYIISYSAVGG